MYKMKLKYRKLKRVNTYDFYIVKYYTTKVL